MKQITIAGGLTRDATVRRTQAGDAILGFSVGVSEGRDKPSTYFDCSLFGKRGEALAQYLTKGTKVTVCGDLSTREHEGKTYLQVRADQITLQGGGQRDDNAGGGYDKPAQEEYARQQTRDMDDEIPF
jgi:single-strand DNA-binding protein